MMTPMYTVANCFGKDRNAAMENINTFMPQVANTAVVTEKIGREWHCPKETTMRTYNGLGWH
jgi:hypothetical protein